MQAVTLRPYQRRFVERWQALPTPRRLFLAWDMGAGKTIAALSALLATASPVPVLIVCPAIVRTTWLRECQRMLPDLHSAIIEYGPARNLSKRLDAERRAAANADVRIVSYDLLPAIYTAPHNFIIIDEFHALRSVSSKQSQAVRKVFAANATASALGLSGTPIPNEAKQLWNPVDTFFPGRWGKQTRKAYEPYSFVKKYCEYEENEYGGKFKGLREDKREELAQAFGQISDRVVQADFAEYLPPLYVESLEIKAKDTPTSIAKAWLDSLPSDVQHIGIYCHLRETAHALAIHLANASSRPVALITGESPAHERDSILEGLRDAQASILIGTTHALQEGISLSFQKAALLIEWTSDVAGVLQFLGRFARQDSTSLAPTRVDIAMGPNDVSAAQVISERVQNINYVIRASRSMEVAAQAFEATPMSDDAFFEQLQTIAVQHQKRTSLWSAQDDDDDEEA